MGRSAVGFVEDSDEDFALLSRVFATRWDVERWSTGERAVSAFLAGDQRATSVAVLLVDHDLPGINGVEVIEQVRASQGAEAPVVCMVSGTGRPAVQAQAIAAGADAFFEKPGSVAGLRELAQRVIDLAAERCLL